MTETALIRDTALSIKLKTIPVKDIQLGMVVHAIGEQLGKLGVKNKGAVKHLALIQQLITCGVKSVVIELPTDTLENKSNQLDDNKTDVANKSLQQAKPVSTKRQHNANLLHLEFARVSSVINKGEQLHQSFKVQIEQNVALEFSEAKLLATEIYNSLYSHPDTMLCLSMIRNANDYLANHATHVATIICYFANYLGMSRVRCEKLALVGYLYDIGMLKVPTNILNSSAQLSDIERVEIQKHVNYSLELLANLDFDRELYLAIEQHHERLDGGGYPNGYAGTKIHKYSRILAIVDCYDALISVRKHKIPLSPAAAMKVLTNPDNGYDQKLVMQFIKCMGIFPVGSLVALSNNRLALVTSVNQTAYAKPIVKTFYSIGGGHFIKPTYINLAKTSLLPPTNPLSRLKIIKPVLASQYGVNIEEIAK